MTIIILAESVIKNNILYGCNIWVQVLKLALCSYVDHKFRCEEQDFSPSRTERLKWSGKSDDRVAFQGQGRRKNIIYPDFIFSIAPNGKTLKLVTLETKGDYLAGNDDTTYKKAVMDLLTNNFKWDDARSIGQMELENGGTQVFCDLILVGEWRKKLPNYFL